jgi:heme oxygenase (mycobilin-producing)
VSITRIGESQAREGKVEELREFLISILPIIRSSEGCESVEMYQNRDDASKFVIIEKWESVELHQASVKDIPPEKLAEIRPLLASAPSGGYYELVSDT